MFDEALLPRHALMQDPAFAQALRMCGQHPIYLPCGLMVLQRRFAGMRVCMIPRAAPPDDLAAQLQTVGLQRTPLVLSPQDGTPMPRALKLSGARPVALWDLNGGISALRQRLHPKWRNQLRRAEAHHTTVKQQPLPPDPDGPVLRNATQQARTRGYTMWPAAITAAFAKIAPAQSLLFTACQNGEDIAHMLFLTHGDTATYHIGHTTPAGKLAGAHNLLLWQAAQCFESAGIQQIDLGVLDIQTPTLNRFKLRTGARTVQTGGTYLYWRPFARR